MLVAASISLRSAPGGYNEARLYAQVRNGDALARITVETLCGSQPD
jgi:hypothetical protein